jgi:tRNA modification GTPase
VDHASEHIETTDTIAAIATGPGAGGIGIVRVSGPRAMAISKTLTAHALRPRSARHVHFSDADGSRIDDGIALLFRAPHSYTGEDVLELQMHGSPPLLRRVLARCCELGARPARPGEFTERAFLNGKLDLAQAEAVADLIAAGSDAAARAARRSLDGAFSQRVQSLLEALTRLRVHVEAAIDFPEEEIDFLADAALAQRFEEVRAEHAALLVEAERGQRLRDGLHVVIVGPPNAGKSSLLNALAGSERAIVTEIAGTTRDLLRESVRLDGVELTMVDTAGLRESSDEIEREGIRRAQAELARADLVLAVVDARNPVNDRAALAATLRDGPALLWLHNKLDLLPDSVLSNPHAISDSADTLWLSARSGVGLDALRQRLRRAAGLELAGPGSGAGQGDEGAFSARARHVDSLRHVGTHLGAAGRQLERGTGELAAEELRLAQDALGEITGRLHSDDLLGVIFSSFCIGK